MGSICTWTTGSVSHLKIGLYFALYASVSFRPCEACQWSSADFAGLPNCDDKTIYLSPLSYFYYNSQFLVRWYMYIQKSLEFSVIITWSSNFTPGCIPKKLKVGIQTKNLDMNFHSSSIHNRQKVETTQMSSADNKQNVVRWNNGIFFSHKKERSTDTCYYVDGPWRCYVN